FELDRAAHLDHIAPGETPVDSTDARGGAGMRQHLRLGRALEAGIAAGVIVVLVGVENLGDLPAVALCRSQAHAPLERVDGKGLAGLRTGDQIVKVAQGISRPDALHQHKAISVRAFTGATYPQNPTRAIMAA